MGLVKRRGKKISIKGAFRIGGNGLWHFSFYVIDKDDARFPISIFYAFECEEINFRVFFFLTKID